MPIEQIKKAKKGDKQAFEEIIMENIDYLYRVAYGILNNEEDISDAVSNTVLKAFGKLKTLKKEEFFKTWITKILINECHDQIRKNKKIVYIDDYKQEQQEKMLYNTNTPEKEIQIDIKQAIKQLEPDLKHIVILYYLQEKSIGEIAQEIHIPEGTVKSRLSRARKSMAEILKYKEDII